MFGVVSCFGLERIRFEVPSKAQKVVVVMVASALILVFVVRLFYCVYITGFLDVDFLGRLWLSGSMLLLSVLFPFLLDPYIGDYYAVASLESWESRSFGGYRSRSRLRRLSVS